MKYLLGLVCMATSASVLAAPADFVRGRVIAADSTQLVQRFTVPQDVYEWVARADLGDLRVFNGEQKEIPYFVRRPASQQEFSPWLEVPTFVLPSAKVGSREGARVSVQVDDGGAVVSVDGHVAQPSEGAAVLVDSSGLDQPISELLVTWPMETGGFIGKFRVDVSDDLDSWRTVVSSATLARLQTDGEQVTVDKIRLADVRSRYLRIVRLEGNAGVQISSVQIRSRLARLPGRDWKTLTGELSEGGYEFATGGLFPIDRVSVDLGQDTFLVVATLFSKARREDDWQRRGQHTFYRVVVDGVTAESEPIVQPARDGYWRVELAGKADRSPELKIGWLPDEIVFLRQGPEPYLLAYGQAGLTGSPWPMADLLSRLGADRDLDSIAPAELRAPNNLGGPGRLVPAPQPVDWQTLILWAVLVIGVAVIGLFAYRLVKVPSES